MSLEANTHNSTLSTEYAVNLLAEPKHSLVPEATAKREGWEWVTLRKIARRQIDKFISLVPETLRDGNLEAVNKMRVTARRLEQILDLLYRKPRPGRVRKLRRQLKTCRHVLGDLRNYDALLALVEQSLALNPSGNLKVWQALKDYLEERRLENAQETLRKFGRINLTTSYLKLRRDLDSEGLFETLTETAGLTNKEATLADDLNQRIRRSLDDRWHEFEEAVEKSRRDPREDVIHHMRVAAKRLRYLIEAMEKLQIERSGETLAWLRSLQQIIGRWHDRELLGHAMSDMVAQHSFHDAHPGLKAEVRRIVRHNCEIKQELERKFSWLTSHSRHYHGTRKWVAELLANVDGHEIETSSHAPTP